MSADLAKSLALTLDALERAQAQLEELTQDRDAWQFSANQQLARADTLERVAKKWHAVADLLAKATAATGDNSPDLLTALEAYHDART